MERDKERQLNILIDAIEEDAYSEGYDAALEDAMEVAKYETKNLHQLLQRIKKAREEGGLI